jgi:putative addiction module antidote
MQSSRHVHLHRHRDDIAAREPPVERKIFKTGNSLAVTLPPDLIHNLGLREGSFVTVEPDPERGGILIAPATIDVSSVDAAFAERVNGFIERYRPALERLAER